MFMNGSLLSNWASPMILTPPEPQGPPLPACGERSRAQRAGEGGSPDTEFLENPPHPDPLPASGERECTESVSLLLVAAGARDLLLQHVPDVELEPAEFRRCRQCHQVARAGKRHL